MIGSLSAIGLQSPSYLNFPQVKEEKEEEKMNRYKVRPLRDFSSAFEKRMIAKEKAKIEEERLQHEKEEAAKIAVSILSIIVIVPGIQYAELPMSIMQPCTFINAVLKCSVN